MNEGTIKKSTPILKFSDWGVFILPERSNLTLNSRKFIAFYFSFLFCTL